MTPLTTTSILSCSELDEAIHQAEMEELSSRIFDLPNYDCDILVTFEDDYHKKMNVPLAYESNLHRIFEFMETHDMKHGVDAYLTDEQLLAFRLYGQGYSYQGKDDQLTTLVTIKCFGEGMVPIDMGKVFAPPSQDLQKDLSV